MMRRSLQKLGVFFVLSFVLGDSRLIFASQEPPGIFAGNKMDDGDPLALGDPFETQDKPEDALPNEVKDAPGYESTRYESKRYKKPEKSSATTIAKIVQDAISRHPSIHADKEALSAAEDVIDQAKAGYMPSVDFRVSLGRENIRRDFSVNTLSPLPSVGSLTVTRSDPSITIRQILFDGMGVAARVERARSQRFQARGTLGMTTDTATIDAATAVIDLRRLQRLMRIVSNNIRFHQLIKEKMDEVVQAGAAPLSDSLQLAARLEDTFVSQANIQSDLAVAHAKFIEVVGQEPPDHLKRIRLPRHLIPESVETAVRMALDNNNAIKVAKSNMQIAATNHQETAAKLLPTVTLEVEGERDRNVSASTGFQNRITAMFVARQNLFSGGADLAKSRETVKRLTESHARLDLARRQAERTIRAAWAEATSSSAKSAHLTKLAQEKRRIRDLYLIEFTVGKRTLMDILDAANDAFLTEASRTTVDATADINTIILSISTGQFQKFMSKPEKNDGFDGDQASDLISYGADLDALSAKKRKSKIKNIAFKRKSIFERRKEERQKYISEKSTT